MPRSDLIQVRRDTASNWTSANPTLASGEIGFETDTGKFKIGTGSASWTALLYATDASDVSGVFSSLSVSGDVVIDTSTLKVDSTLNRVGIGTASPASMLHIADSSGYGVQINSTTNQGLIGTNSESDALRISGGIPDTFVVGGNIYLYGNAHATRAGSAAILTNGTEAITVASTGFVGIGVTSPTYSLHVSGSSYFEGTVTTSSTYNITAGGYIYSTAGRIYPKTSDENYITAPASGDYGSIEVAGTGKGGYRGYSIGGRVVFMHDGSSVWGIYNDVNNEWLIYGELNGPQKIFYDNALKFETTSYGAYVTGNLAMSGNLEFNIAILYGGGIAYYGTTHPGGSPNQIGFRWSSPYVSVAVDNVISANFVNLSDSRLKTNIQDFTHGIEAVRQLRSVTYNPLDVVGFDEETHDPIIGDKDPYDELIGFVADEVMEVIPTAVHGKENNNIKSIDNQQLLAVVVSALQNIDNRLSMLENK